MFCKKCGFEYSDSEGIAFCKRCGAPVIHIGEYPTISQISQEAFKPSEISSNDTEVRKNWKKVIAVVIPILVIAAVGVMWFINRPIKEGEGINDSASVSNTEETEKKEEDIKKIIEEEATPKESDNDSAIEDSVLSSEEADEMFTKYLRGELKDADGESFWAVNDTETEYVLHDVNNDGQNELIVRSYGYWIPDIIQYKDGKITFSKVENVGSSGISVINNNNQFVSGDTSHEGRDQFWISEIDKSGNSKVVLFFANYWGDWAESGSPEYYKKVLPETEDFTSDDCEKIDETEYKKLLNEYNQENKSLNWQKVSQVIDGDDGEATSNTPSASIENLDLIIKAYDNYMSQNYNSEYGAVEISLIYINSDNVPEAIIQQNGDISWSVIGYEDGKAVELSGCIIDSLFYEPKGNHFFYEWSDGEESGTVSCTTNGNKINTWSIDEIYTTQGTEYYYSDETTNNKKISESEAKKYFNEASMGCIKYEGDFYSNAREAFNNLKEVDEPIADVERELRIKSIVATSTLKANSVDGMTYVAENLYDGNFSTPWVEGVDGVGIGERITIKLDGVHEINSLLIYNGILKSKRRCMINGQTTKIEINWGDGNKQTANVDVNNYPEEEKAILIADLSPTFIEPNKQCKTDTITITILDAVSGSKYDDVGISEIRIYGK